ncbi:paraquat-inducible protein B [Geopseudomonas sagittaria]|uniref:Paraquat-inducible protein B n=1 Tax=Geopseudomonas sagittaria TaxID=1135990 RepID=A0A1I5T1Q4_9GAMM|nr:MlaD family protein [Pseudomonas sagittaria]MCM2331240.1 MlaD family protein [Pseudomonas sagittaria]SFP76984.1 paraquat-inducible protein B [Pseudomonas sagittaria]
MSEPRKPFWIGAFLLSGIALLAGGLLLLGRDNWFSQPSDYVVYFTGALDGLDVGADVTYRGVKVGTVREIRLSYDRELKDVVIPVVLRINPDAGREGQRFDRVVERLVERGLRAQLQTQSLLTGKAIVALDLFPGQAGYVREPHDLELPTIPSVPSRVDQAADVLRDLLDTLRELPLGEMIVSASNTLQALERLSASPELRGGLLSLGQTLSNLEGLTQQLQRQIPPILDNARQGSGELRTAIGDLRQAAQAATVALQQMQGLAGDTQRSLGPESEAQFQLLQTLEELGRASKALQRTAESLEQQPESLIFGNKR